MRDAVIIALLLVILFGLGFLWTRRAYFTEVQRLLSEHRPEIPMVFTGQSATELGFYYVLDREETAQHVTIEEAQSIEKHWAPPLAYGAADHPVAIAQDGLRSFNRFKATKHDRFLQRAKAASDLLLRLQHPDGSWRYTFAFNDLEAGWASAMAQGQGASLLLRVFQATGDDRYLEAAARAMRFALAPIAEGGTLDAFADGQPILEEYPSSHFSPLTLNGSIFALWGLRDLAMVTADAALERRFVELAEALASHLGDYDTGDWSLYSLRADRSHLSDDKYHAVHVAQTRVMGVLTDDGRWNRAGSRWESYFYRRHPRSSFKIWWRDLRRRLAVAIARRFGRGRA